MPPFFDCLPLNVDVAHRRRGDTATAAQDAINCGYLSLREEDYEWVTQQLLKIANAHCDGEWVDGGGGWHVGATYPGRAAASSCAGRLVSVLEGGYRIHGRTVSAFGRSVAAHVRTLASGYAGVWDTDAEIAALQSELQAEAEADAARAAAVAAAANEAESRGDAMDESRPSLAAFLPGGGTPRLARMDSAGSAVSGFAGPAGIGGGIPLFTPMPLSGPEASPMGPSTSSALTSPMPPAGAPATVSNAGAVSERVGSKRRRPPVDYAALDAKLRSDATSGAIGAAGSGTGASLVALMAAAGTGGGDETATPAKVARLDADQAPAAEDRSDGRV